MVRSIALSESTPPPAALSGCLLVNKPSGPTSYDIIRWIKRNVKGVKIGHCGTLDPLASGLLILLFGRATKRQDELMHQQKTYRCRARLGYKTDSGDRTGTVIEERPAPPIDPSRVAEALAGFVGDRLQLPPMYSALKLKGVPLYKLARKGETVERTPRSITIVSMELLDVRGNEFEFRVRCSSGTYVRTLAEEIAEALGTVGTMAELEREAIGSFALTGALPAERAREMSAEELSRAVFEIPAP